MQLSEAIVQRIDYLLDKENMSLYNLCMRAGIPYSTLNGFMNGRTTIIRLETLLHVCEGFNITLEKFFADKKFIDVEAEIVRGKKEE